MWCPHLFLFLFWLDIFDVFNLYMEESFSALIPILLIISQMEMMQVNAIRNGSLDSLYDTMHTLDEIEGLVVSSEPSDVLIEVGQSNKDKEVTSRK